MNMKMITILDNEEYLRQISKEVDIKNDKELEENIKMLKSFCGPNEALALAAIQIGIPKRLIYLKNTNLDIVKKIQNDTFTEEDKLYDEAKVLINPVILKREGLTEYWETCASCLDNCGLVERPYKILVEYYDTLGNKHEEIFEGFESTVLSHEMDHLDGILHMDKSKELIVMPLEERKIFRKDHGYNIITKIGDFEDLKGL